MKQRRLAALLVLALALTLLPAAGAAWEEMEPGEGCVAYIKTFEGFSALPYSDGTGWYIGYGVACNPGDYPDGVTEEEADALLRDKLAGFAESVNAFLRRYDVSVTQGQFDALCAMTYNFGPAWLNTAYRLPAYIADGVENYTDGEIMNAFAAWCHVGGAVSEGLLRRRMVEAKMFLYDDYSMDSSDWTWLVLNAGGGQVASDVACYRVGEPYGALPAAAREGYVFGGWVKPGGQALLEETDIALGSAAVTALWLAAEPAEEPEPSPEPRSAPEAGETDYPDVPAGSWYSGYVAKLSEQGVVSGFEDGTFRPAENVSWGQALKLILLAAGYPEQEAEKGEHWASGYRAYAVKKNFLSAEAAADLDAPILRGEIAALAALALELDTADTGERPFADDHQGAALALYRIGVMEGSIENGYRVFKGGEAITRAEISAVIWRVADYVDRTLILFHDYRIPIDQSLDANPYDDGAFALSGGRMTYSDPAYTVRYGIDVSYYQKEIDWQAVAADGIDFAILRVGYRGCSGGTLNVDERFYEYIEGALSAGIEVGVYFFSQALNAAEAAEEADYVLSLIEGYDVRWPIAFDWEPLNYSYSRTRNYDYSALTDCAVAFCDTVEAAGYRAMVYMNPSFAYLRYDLSRLKGRSIWLAHYTDTPEYYYDFQMWQYSSSGNVRGISGWVDLDVAFYDWWELG